MDPRELILNDALQCDWASAPYLLFSENVFSPLIYYSHLFPALAGLLVAFIIWRQAGSALISRLLVVLALSFSIWSLFDLILWATDDTDLIMFFWSSLIYFEPLIYATALYIVYLFVTNEDPPLYLKMIAGGLFVPILILAPTNLNLVGFDYTNCDREAIEGALWYYTYMVELIFVGWILVFVMERLQKVKEVARRKQIVLLTTGMIMFLLTFSWGNIVGSLSFDWTIAQYGLFGLPIFLGFLSYLIVRFKSFHIQLIGAEALVLSLWVLLFSLLFLQTISSARPIIFVTLILYGVLGYYLVNGVKREIEQRKQIEDLASNLRKANERLRELDRQKTEFVSIASHQLRSPLTAITGYASLLLEGSFGLLPDQAKGSIEKIFHSGKQMAVSIDDFLNVARIEQGRMKYTKVSFDMRELVERTADEIRILANNKGLTIDFNVPNEPHMVYADKGKITQVVTNLLDNSIKYTKEGSITVSLDKVSKKQQESMVRFSVSDTGIGMSRESQTSLFQKFSRAENANTASVRGTGLGLYIAKQMILAHNGEIWGISKGEGKGSEFGFTLPAEGKIGQ